MYKYVIITENDESKWNDQTGTLYHFPNKYKKILITGTKFIYYKGIIKNKKYETSREMNEPHYFGKGVIGNVYQDGDNPKNFYAEIEEYKSFSKGIYFKKNNGSYFENVLTNNHWRDGVRTIDQNVYNDILNSNEEKLDTIESSDEDFKIELTNNSIIKFNIDSKKTKSNFDYIPKNIKNIGDKGEEIVLEYLKNQLSKKELLTLRWIANEGKTPGYDIEYISDNQDTICIEVKSTTANKFSYFHLTINEYNAAQMNDKYFIYLVTNCMSNNPKIEILKNPFKDDNFLLDPIQFKVYKLE